MRDFDWIQLIYDVVSFALVSFQQMISLSPLDANSALGAQQEHHGLQGRISLRLGRQQGIVALED